MDDLDHVYYEFEQFFEAAKKLNEISSISYEACDKEHKPYLELFLLHSRVIYEFLSCKSIYNNSINSTDFIQEALKSDYLESEYDYIHEYVAHLTKSRNKEKIWDILKIKNELYGKIKSFVSKLNHNERIRFKFIDDTNLSTSSLDISSTNCI